jgi:outer membrane protein TolC
MTDQHTPTDLRWKTVTKWICLSVYALSAISAHGQTQMQQPQGARVQQVPLSTREQGNISIKQQAGAGAGGSVNTVQSTVNVVGHYQGSVPDPSSASPSLILSLPDAIQRGLRFNLGGVTASNMKAQTRNQRLAALSQLLPSINGVLSETVAQLYLPADGISSMTFGGGGSVKVPATTGQFHYYTLQGSVSEDAFDLTALHNLRGAEAADRAAQLNAKDARELVILGVGGTYIQTIAAAANVDAQRGEVLLAQASYKQATAQHGAGTRAIIDANRSLVELKTEQQRLASDEAEFSKQKIRLGRLIGLSPATQITLSSRLSDAIPFPGPIEDAIAHGKMQRSDLKAAEQQMQAAAQARKAAQAEYLPTVSVNGNYGLQGTSPDVGRVAYSGVASINIPIWQGGRVKADTGQADAILAQRKSEYDDQRIQVEADIRISYIDLNVAMELVKVARENQALAGETLKQSQDRFNAGVTDSVEVVQALESLSSADRDYLSSLYSQTLARLHLAQATGDAETQISTLLEGSN